MRKVLPNGCFGPAGRLAALLLLMLGADATRAEGPGRGGVAIEAACQPAALGAVALGALGLTLVTRELDDRGFAVERWQEANRDGTGAWALVILLRDAAGGERRCLVFHRLPAPGAPA